MTQPISFRYTFPVSKAEEREDGLYIIGEASGPEIDATAERMAPEAIALFAAQIESMASAGTPLPYRDAHAKDGVWRDLGEITRAWIDERFHLGIEVRLDSDSAAAVYLFKQIKDKRKQFGMSIGGTVIDYVDEFVQEVGRLIRTYKQIVLDEISNTTRPAWTPSFGTVLSKAIDEATAESIATQGENVDLEKDALAAGDSTEATPAEGAAPEGDAEKALTPEEIAETFADIANTGDADEETPAADADEAAAESETETEPAADADAEKSAEDEGEAVEKDSHAARDFRDAAYTVASLAHLLAEDVTDTNTADTAPKLRAAMDALMGFMASELAQVGTAGDVADTVADQMETLADQAAFAEMSDTTSASEETAAKTEDEAPAADEAAETEATDKAAEGAETDVEKAGRSISAANAARLMGLYGQMASALKEMGLLAAEDAPAKSDSSEAESALTKSLTAEKAVLEGKVQELTDLVAEKTARITELENMPATATPALVKSDTDDAVEAVEKARQLAPFDRLRLGLSLAHSE